MEEEFVEEVIEENEEEIIGITDEEEVENESN